MHRKLLSIVTIFALLLVAGCGGTSGSKASSTTLQEKSQPLKIGVQPIEDNLPFYVAEADKIYEKEGIKVTLIPFKSAQERDAALQAGQIDGELADLLAVALLKKGGTDVKVASIGLGANPKEGRFAILTAPNSKIKNASDLKNVQIAISDNSIIEYVTDQMLKDSGLSKSEIKKVAIPNMPVRMQMLSSGQVQAATLPDPLATMAQKQGAHVILDDTKIKTNLSQTVILFRQDRIKAKKEAIRSLIKAYGEAGQALTKSPDKYRQLLVEKANIPAPIKDSYKSPTFTMPQLPKEADLNRVMKWMVEKKLLTKAYTYNDLVDKSLL